MLALMLLISLASAACSGKRNSYYTHMQEDALYGNRLFNFWCNEIGGDRKRAPDLRMYNQMEKVGATYFGEDHSFDVHSRIAGEARGIMGFWAALSGAVSVVLTGRSTSSSASRRWAGPSGSARSPSMSARLPGCSWESARSCMC